MWTQFCMEWHKLYKIPSCSVNQIQIEPHHMLGSDWCPGNCRSWAHLWYLRHLQHLPLVSSTSSTSAIFDISLFDRHAWNGKKRMAHHCKFLHYVNHCPCCTVTIAIDFQHEEWTFFGSTLAQVLEVAGALKLRVMGIDGRSPGPHRNCRWPMNSYKIKTLEPDPTKMYTDITL